MRHVILQGHLGDKYGSSWDIKAKNFRDIFSCIDANYPGFRQDLIDLALAGGDIDVQLGNTFLDAEDLFFPIGTKDTVVITPIPAGAKSGSAKILAAVALVALTFAISPVVGTFAAGKMSATMAYLLVTYGIAANLAMVGLEQLMTPDPSVDDTEEDYLFSSAENTVASGNPVPVLLGELIVGGTVISSGITSGTQIQPSHSAIILDRDEAAINGDPWTPGPSVPGEGEFTPDVPQDTPVTTISSFPAADEDSDPNSGSNDDYVTERYLGGQYA
jgi:predicted phage tail protein